MPELARAARRAAERVVRAVRHRRALARVRRHPLSSILVVCHGNICRSPFAARRLARALPGVRVTSAGFVGPEGRGSPEGAVVAAALLGEDLGDHRSQLITPALAYDASVIVVMNTEQQRAVCRRFGRWPSDVVLLGDCDPAPDAPRAIADPVLGPLDRFYRCYARIDGCVAVLAEAATRCGDGVGALVSAARVPALRA